MVVHVDNPRDRRTPFIESRRQSDCFPDGGAVAVTIAAFSAIYFILGFVLGYWRC